MNLKQFAKIEKLAEYLKSNAEENHSGLCLECYKKAINDILELIKKN